MNRRHFLASLSATPLSLIPTSTRAEPQPQQPQPQRLNNPIGISTYSFWRTRTPIEACIDRAADWGFDGIELLQKQLPSTDNPYLQSLKKRAFQRGLAMIGYSTHQDFVEPDPEVRQHEINKTIAFLEQAYSLGIPTIRINTGRWGTSKNFNELMANRGIEPRLPGITDDQAYTWVIDAITQLIPEAEKRGITLGLENHWGLRLTPEGLLRILNAINSPWLKATVDTGNFLEDPYERLEQIADRAVLLQAKTYFGGGVWYTLDLDYPRIATIMQRANFDGWISLEYEGRAPIDPAIPDSLRLLRNAF